MVTSDSARARGQHAHAGRAAALIGALLGFASAFLVVGSPQASADPWGIDELDGTGAHPDSDPHTYCYGASIPAGVVANIESAEWNALDPTAVNVDYKTLCNYSSSQETDVVWAIDDLPSGTRGTSYCEDVDTWCDQYYAMLDPTEINKGSNDQADQIKTACHELGHTTGLTHGGNVDCMMSGEVPSTAIKWQRYGDHHKSHLTAWFN